MDVGRTMGVGIAEFHPMLLPVVGFLLGMVVVLAEPAVYVLTEQIEDVTAGHIKRRGDYGGPVHRHRPVQFPFP